MPHAQGVDRKSAVEHRQGRRPEQAEVPAGGGERQVGPAELEAPEPPGVPGKPRLEQRIVNRAGERGSQGVVVPAQRAAKSLEGDGGVFTAERDALELEYRLRRQPRGNLDVTVHRAAARDVAKRRVDQERLGVGRQGRGERERFEVNARVGQQRLTGEVHAGRAARVHDARMVEGEGACVEAQGFRVQYAVEVERRGMRCEVEEHRVAVSLACAEREPAPRFHPARVRKGCVNAERASELLAGERAFRVREIERLDRELSAGRRERVAGPGRTEVAAGATSEAQALGKRDPGFCDLGELREVQSDEPRVSLPGAARQRDCEPSARAGDREVFEVEPQPAIGATARRETAVLGAERAQRARKLAALAAQLVACNAQFRAVDCESRERSGRLEAAHARSAQRHCARRRVGCPVDRQALDREPLELEFSRREAHRARGAGFGARGETGERKRGDRHGTPGAIHRPSLPPRRNHVLASAGSSRSRDSRASSSTERAA